MNRLKKPVQMSRMVFEYQGDKIVIYATDYLEGYRKARKLFGAPDIKLHKDGTFEHNGLDLADQKFTRAMSQKGVHSFVVIEGKAS